jgi:ketosteroid isomerase-like protein
VPPSREIEPTIAPSPEAGPDPFAAILHSVTGVSNREIVERLYADFLSVPERVTSPEVLDFFDPQVELEQSGSIVGTEGTFHGYDGLARSLREVFQAFRDIHWVPQRIEAGQDDVVAVVESRGYGRESGVEVRALTVHTWTLRDGRIVRWHVYIPHADPASESSR